MWNKIYKFKSSIDLFLGSDRFLTIYYMNTRQRISFRVNSETVHLLEQIDGIHTVGEICETMFQKFDVSADSVCEVIELLVKKRVITEKLENIVALTKDDMERFSRQINYFSEFLENEFDGMLAQKKVINSKVAIFGCGAVGGDIAIQLVMAGVRHLTLIDVDVVEMSDEARHLYYSESDIGKSKVEALKEQLQLIDSKAELTCIRHGLKPTDDIEHIIQNCDFVINTMDEPYIGYTSSKISRVCVKHNIPHYIAGGFDAHLASTGEIIIPFVTPCVECYAMHFKKTLKNWKPKPHPVKTRYTEIGGLASMSLFSSSFAVIEIIKYLAGLVKMEDNYKVRGELMFNDLKLTYLNVGRNPKCPVCGKESKL